MSDWQSFCSLFKVPKKYTDPQITSKTDMEAYSYIQEWLKYPTCSLLLVGPPGRGKTYATYYIMNQILKKNPDASIRFFRSSDADQKMVEEMKEWGSTRHFIDTLFEVPLLVLDDFGIECNSERMERNYYDLLDKRLAHDRPTIISTNVELTKFEPVFGSRIASRLQEYVKVRFKKEDLRNL